MIILGDADQDVIPVENSHYGEVADSNDAICSTRNSLHIIGELYEPIRHCLIGNSGDLNDIKQVDCGVIIRRFLPIIFRRW